MNYNDWSYIGHLNGWLGSPLEGAATSKAATTSLAVRAGSQRAKLLAVYVNAVGGLTDEAAAVLSGLEAKRRCCWWKRCSDLRQAGFITETWWTGISSTGAAVVACEITAKGRNAYKTIQLLQQRGTK